MREKSDLHTNVVTIGRYTHVTEGSVVGEQLSLSGSSAMVDVSIPEVIPDIPLRVLHLHVGAESWGESNA